MYHSCLAFKEVLSNSEMKICSPGDLFFGINYMFPETKIFSFFMITGCRVSISFMKGVTGTYLRTKQSQGSAVQCIKPRIFTEAPYFCNIVLNLEIVEFLERRKLHPDVGIKMVKARAINPFSIRLATKSSITT